MFSLFISTFYLFRKIFTCQPGTIHPSRSRARNIGLSYLAGDLKIIQARRSMHHRRDVNPGGGRNDHRDILSRCTAYSDLFDYFLCQWYPIILNYTDSTTMCIDTYIYIYVYILLMVQKSCTTWDVQNLSTGAGFLPSTIYIYIHIFFSWMVRPPPKQNGAMKSEQFILLSWNTGSLYDQPKNYCKGNPSKLQYICIVWMTPVKEMQEFWNHPEKKKKNATIIGQSWVSLFHVHDEAKVEATRSEGSVTSSGPRTNSSAASRLLTSPYYTMVGDFHHEKYKSIWHHLPLSGDSFQPKKHMFKPPTTYSRFTTFTLKLLQSNLQIVGLVQDIHLINR